MLKAKQIIVSGTAHNVLAEGTVLKGEVKAEEDFRIDGVVEGIISCNGKIVIGPKGFVNGQVSCINAELLGRLQGTIKVAETLVLKASAVYLGDAFTKTMEIEPGAVFNGACTMTNNNNNTTAHTEG